MGEKQKPSEPIEPSDPKDVLGELTEKIRSEFPDLTFYEVKLVEEGLDNLIVILDEKWVFRFPRITKYIKSFQREVELLKNVKDEVPVAVPDYEYLSKEKDFGGYKMIKGGELTPEAFEDLPEDVKKKIAQQLGEFLSALHRLSPEFVIDDRAWRSPAFFEKRYSTNRREILAENIARDLLGRIDNFYKKFSEMEISRSNVVHADLSSRHILLSPEKTNISGIIDFGEMAVGDPADDFQGFWSYGEDFLKEVLRHYALEKDDSLTNRSHLYFIRFLIDRLYRKLDRGQNPEEAKLILGEHLSKIGC